MGLGASGCGENSPILAAAQLFLKNNSPTLWCSITPIFLRPGAQEDFPRDHFRLVSADRLRLP
jgi:hypothetical protein